MAQYKVPQDVEADDKLIGPFSFRQFVYLLISAGLLAIAWWLFGIFPLLAIIPLPIVFFLLILALPLKKDQPMETYIAAIISFHTKPTRRFWNPGQRESTIVITAPKVVEEIRARNITGDDASRRLSFLANVVDSEGYSIKNGVGTVRDEFVAEANATPDMFDIYETQRLSTAIADDAAERHTALVEQMRSAIEQSNSLVAQAYNPATAATPTPPMPTAQPAYDESNSEPNLSVFGTTTTPASSDAQYIPPEERYVAPKTAAFTNPVPLPTSTINQPLPAEPTPIPESKPEEPPSPEFYNLAHNEDFSIATIAKEAKRMTRKADDKEVYISLH